MYLPSLSSLAYFLRRRPKASHRVNHMTPLYSRLTRKHYTRLEGLGKGQNSILLPNFVSYVRKKAYNIGPRLPQEPTSSSAGLIHFSFLSINYNTELIFVGGYITNPFSDVWKFVYNNNSWTKLGALSTPICQHNSFVVYNVSCT